MADWISIEEAQALSQYNATHLRRLMRRQKVQGEKKGGRWWVDRKSLLAYLRDSQQSDDKRRGPKQ